MIIDFSNIFLFFLLIFLIIIFHYLLGGDKNPRHARFAKQFPGPKSYPFVGNSLDFRGNGQDILKKLFEYAETYKSPFRLWFGSHLFIVISDSENLQTVFSSTKCLGRPKLFKKFVDLLGGNLFTEPDPSIWKKDRKMMQMSFVPKSLHAYVPYFNKNVEILSEKFSKHLIDGEEFDLTDHFQHLSFDIITQSVLGKTFDADGMTGKLFEKTIQRITDVSLHYIIKPWTRLKPVEWIRAKEYSSLRSTIFKIVEGISDEKMSLLERETNERKRLDDEKREENSPKTLLNILYEISKEGEDMEQMHSEMITVITGGVSAVSVSLTFMFSTLGIYQEIQDRVYEEIYEVFGDSNREADEHDMKKLTYLEQVVKETLRRFTLVPMIFRVVEKDCKIGQHVYPQGTGLVVFPLGAHFNPKYYPDPFKFNPDNFSPKAIENRPKYTFIPFSAGARNCLGASYALLEMKLIACGLLRKYKFYSSTKFEDIKLQTRTLLSNVDECKVSIKRRNP